MQPKKSRVRRVLLVDDDESICAVIGDIFTALAPETVELTCLTSDLAAYRTFAEDAGFDAILIDINLGRGTTGYDVARKARAADPEVQVVYISGQIDQRSVNTHGVAGSVFLLKPFTPERLLQVLGLEPARLR